MSLAQLWQIIAWDDGIHFCHRCWKPIRQAEAEPFTEYPYGWQHRGECPT